MLRNFSSASARLSWPRKRSSSTFSSALHLDLFQYRVGRRPFSAQIAGIGRATLSPAVRHLILQHQLDLSQIQGSGPRGLVLKGDVLKYVSSPPPKATGPASSPQGTFIPSTPPSSSLAKDPHHYFSVSVPLDEISEIQTLLKERENLDLPLTAFIARAAGLALQEVSEANVFWDAQTQTIQRYKTVSIGVLTEGTEGSIYSVIPSTPFQSLGAIANIISTSVKSGVSTGGATFSLFSSSQADECFTIVPPFQTGALVVGHPQQVVLPKNGKIIVSSIASLTLSVDPRAIDEFSAARLLEAIRKYAANPRALM